MRTSETVTDLGLYTSECCSEKVIFDVGDSFRRCPKCHALCIWEFEDEVVDPEEVKRESGVAA